MSEHHYYAALYAYYYPEEYRRYFGYLDDRRYPGRGAFDGVAGARLPEVAPEGAGMGAISGVHPLSGHEGGSGAQHPGEHVQGWVQPSLWQRAGEPEERDDPPPYEEVMASDQH